jgi:hypothetical protein
VGRRKSEIGAEHLRRLALERLVIRADLVRGTFETFEEMTDRHAKDRRNLPKSRRADPIQAGLILLKLLKRYADSRGDLVLGRLKYPPATPNPQSDMKIDCVWQFGFSANASGNSVHSARLCCVNQSFLTANRLALWTRLHNV